MAGNTSQPGAAVTTRIFALLGTFDSAHPRQPLSEMASRAGLPLATAHRLAGQLIEAGALHRRPDGNYVVGRKLWDIGLLAPVQTGLREVASPFLHDLYAATLATVHLAVREDIYALYLDRLAGRTSAPVVSAVGSRLPLHSTGVGKVLLAYAPRDIADRAFAQLTRVTPYTVVHPGMLSAQLERVRREGYATTVAEMSLGACSAAVPIVNGDTVVGALGVVVPSLKRNRAGLVAALQVAAQGVSRSLSRQPADAPVRP